MGLLSGLLDIPGWFKSDSQTALDSIPQYQKAIGEGGARDAQELSDRILGGYTMNPDGTYSSKAGASDILKNRVANAGTKVDPYGNPEIAKASYENARSTNLETGAQLGAGTQSLIGQGAQATINAGDRLNGAVTALGKAGDINEGARNTIGGASLDIGAANKMNANAASAAGKIATVGQDARKGAVNDLGAARGAVAQGQGLLGQASGLVGGAQQQLAQGNQDLNIVRRSAMGQGPSAAEVQGRAMLDSATRQQQSAAGAARGGNLAAAQRNASMAGTQTRLQGEQQIAAQRAQEQLNAQGLLTQGNASQTGAASGLISGVGGLAGQAGNLAGAATGVAGQGNQIRQGDVAQQGAAAQGLQASAGQAGTNAGLSLQQGGLMQQNANAEGALAGQQLGVAQTANQNAGLYQGLAGQSNANAGMQAGLVSQGMSNQTTLAGTFQQGLQSQEQAEQNAANDYLNYLQRQYSLSSGLPAGQYSATAGLVGQTTAANTEAQATLAKAVGAAAIASDERLKTDIVPNDTVVEQLALVRPAEYRYIDEDAHGQGRRLGVMAQELTAAGLGNIVLDTPTGQYLDVNKALSLALAAVAALSRRVMELENGKGN